VRYSSAGNRVEVEVRRTDKAAVITVQDEGQGIPEGYLDKVFARFVQVPGIDGRERGTGIGLTIARSVAELHNGTISARNRDGGGCAFEVTLPLASQASAE
jgi:signal transduction histidine kinase